MPSIIKDEGLEAQLKSIQGVIIKPLAYRAAGGSWMRTEIVKMYNMCAVWHLQRFIKEEKVDTIYSNTCITILGVQLARWSKIRHIWHWHESPQVWFEWNNLTKAIYKNFIRYAETIICISQAQLREWERILGIDIKNASVIYNPIKSIKLAERNEAEDVVRVGFIGHFEKLKNIETLVKSFEVMHEKEKNTRLILCGAKDDADKVYGEKMTSLKAPDLEILWQTNDVTSFYNSIDILVLPSWYETMPLVVLEAMQAGVCVLQTDRSGMKELIEDGKESLFFAPDDADTLSAYLMRCMNADYRRQIAEAGQKKALQLLKNQQFDQQIQTLLCE